MPSLDRFAVDAARAALRGGRSFIARVTLAWCTKRRRLSPSPI